MFTTNPVHQPSTRKPLRLDISARLFLVTVGTFLVLIAVLLSRPESVGIIACDVIIAGLLAFNAQAFYLARTYLFSSGFWTALFFTFYFILKSTEYVGEDESGRITAVLVHCIIFLFFYNIGYFTSKDKKALPVPDFSVINSGRFVKACLAVFVLSRIFYLLTVAIVLRGDYNQLELLASTQNQGMSYIFKAFSIGQLAFLMLMIYGFIYRRHALYIFIAIVVYMIDVLGNASRGALIVLILSVLFLYGRYVRPISWVWMALLAPPLVFIVSFLGYVRNLELGSLSVYWDAIGYFLEEGDVVWTLFMGRLDLLPAVAAGLEAHAQGNLPSLWGSSYVNMFLHFIPRNIWPAKPPLTAAYVTAVVAPGPFEDGVLIYPTMFLEGFLNFGIAGIAIAGTLAGKFSARYDRWMLEHGFGKTFYFLTFFTFPLGLIGEGLHSNFFATSLYTVALVCLLIWLLHRIGAIGIEDRLPHRHSKEKIRER